ncbi:MAG: hypothetical protein Q9195_001490 [Heterodermia aff. obscurata]
MLRQLFCSAPVKGKNAALSQISRRLQSTASSNSSSREDSPKNPTPESLPDESKVGQEPKQKKKTMAEIDEELRLKLEGISGGGGEAGLELENGQPVAMKRSVRENMFRLI